MFSYLLRENLWNKICPISISTRSQNLKSLEVDRERCDSSHYTAFSKIFLAKLALLKQNIKENHEFYDRTFDIKFILFKALTTDKQQNYPKGNSAKGNTMHRFSASVVICFLFMQCCGKTTNCPKRCRCLLSIVKCTYQDLKEIPNDIPLSTTSLDLSHNPSLGFTSNAFLKFRQLQVLRLNNCSRKGPVLLPESVRRVELAMNSFTVESIKETFQNSSKTLEVIDISGNSLDMKQVLHSIPKWIKHLVSCLNILKTLGEHDLERFTGMRRLMLCGCSLSKIEPKAFDSLKQLDRLVLYDNLLRSLPKKLFQFNVNLREIILYGNHLESLPDLQGIPSLSRLDLVKNNLKHFNASELGIKNIASLLLGSNRISSLNLKGLKVFQLDLSRNRIIKLGDFAFEGRNKIRILFLQNNNMNYISPKAFRNIETIGELYLQRNKIERLPTDVFKGMHITKLILYGNMLSSMHGVLDRMTIAPNLLLLFSNPQFKYFKAEDFRSMSNGSEIFITCKNLKEISEHKALRASIKCSPSPDLKIRTPTHALKGDGYKCIYSHKKFAYDCYPCPVGERGSCEGQKCGGKCVQCPPGAFYQDEMATTSCKVCPVGQYVPPELSPGKSAVDCLTCPKGTDTSSPAGYRACKCLTGFARTYRFGECKQCTEQGFTCTKDFKQLKKGFWMSWKSAPDGDACKKSYKAFTYNLETWNNDYERNTMNLSCALPVPHKCPIHGSCLGTIDANCSKGYTGVLCAVCDKGHSHQFNKCVKCPKQAIAILQFVGYILLFVFICLLVTWTDKVTLSSEGNDDDQEEPRTFADIILSSLKILLGFYQVLSGVIHAFSYIHWPKNLKTAVGTFEYIQFEVLRIPSLRCINPEWQMNSVSEFWLALIATAAIPVLVLVYFLMKAILIYCTSQTMCVAKEKRKHCARNCCRAAALFLFATYPITSKRITQILPMSCHKFCAYTENGQCLQYLSYLRSDYSVRCLSMSSDKNDTLIVAYVSLLIPLGLPFLLLLLLWRFAPKREEQRYPVQDMYQPNEGLLPEDQDSGLQYFNVNVLDTTNATKKDNLVVTKAIKFAYENYIESCWYWEVRQIL